jgi:hypothetical protein
MTFDTEITKDGINAGDFFRTKDERIVTTLTAVENPVSGGLKTKDQGQTTKD